MRARPVCHSRRPPPTNKSDVVTSVRSTPTRPLWVIGTLASAATRPATAPSVTSRRVIWLRQATMTRTAIADKAVSTITQGCCVIPITKSTTSAATMLHSIRWKPSLGKTIGARSGRAIAGGGLWARCQINVLIKLTDAMPMIKLTLGSHWPATRLATSAAATTLHWSTSATWDAVMPPPSVARPGVSTVMGTSFTESLAVCGRP